MKIRCIIREYLGSRPRDELTGIVETTGRSSGSYHHHILSSFQIPNITTSIHNTAWIFIKTTNGISKWTNDGN